MYHLRIQPRAPITNETNSRRAMPTLPPSFLRDINGKKWWYDVNWEAVAVSNVKAMTRDAIKEALTESGLVHCSLPEWLRTVTLDRDCRFTSSQLQIKVDDLQGCVSFERSRLVRIVESFEEECCDVCGCDCNACNTSWAFSSASYVASWYHVCLSFGIDIIYEYKVVYCAQDIDRYFLGCCYIK